MTQLGRQREVILTVVHEQQHEGDTSAKAIAEAMTMAQQFLPPETRASVPITGAQMGYELRRLREQGLVRCEPESGLTPPNGARRWYEVTA